MEYLTYILFVIITYILIAIVLIYLDDGTSSIKKNMKKAFILTISLVIVVGGGASVFQVNLFQVNSNEEIYKSPKIEISGEGNTEIGNQIIAEKIESSQINSFSDDSRQINIGEYTHVENYGVEGQPADNYTGQWTLQTENAEWSPRYLAGSVTLSDGSIVIMGGSGSGGVYYNDVWRSIDNGVSWTQMTANAEWSGREAMGAVALSDGSIIMMGGSKGWAMLDSIYYNDVWKSVDNGASWTQMTSNAEWDGRAGFGSVAMSDGSIVIMGGNTLLDHRNDVWQSKDLGATWIRLTTFAWLSGKTNFGCVVTTDDDIVVMGGEEKFGYAPSNDVWVSRDKGMTWSLLTARAEWSARKYLGTVAMPDGSIVIMGGTSGTLYLNDAWRTVDTGITWTETDRSAKWSPRIGFGHVSTSNQGNIVLMGGVTRGGLKNDVWLFTPN